MSLCTFLFFFASSFTVFFPLSTSRSFLFVFPLLSWHAHFRPVTSFDFVFLKQISLCCSFFFFFSSFFKLLPINWFTASKHSRVWKKRNAAICSTTKSSFFFLLLLLLCLFELLLLFFLSFWQWPVFFSCFLFCCCCCFIVWRVNRVQRNSVIFLLRGLTLCCFAYEQLKNQHLSKKKKEDKCQMKRSFFLVCLFVFVFSFKSTPAFFFTVFSYFCGFFPFGGGGTHVFWF